MSSSSIRLALMRFKESGYYFEYPVLLLSSGFDFKFCFSSSVLRSLKREISGFSGKINVCWKRYLSFFSHGLKFKEKVIWWLSPINSAKLMKNASHCLTSTLLKLSKLLFELYPTFFCTNYDGPFAFLGRSLPVALAWSSFIRDLKFVAFFKFPFCNQELISIPRLNSCNTIIQIVVALL